MFFSQQYAPIDLIQHMHGLSYAKDFLGKLSLPIASMRDGNQLAGMSHVELRHDVDYSLDVAVAMAHIERNLGVTATYFFLHPDGVLAKSNYFGYIHKNRVHLSPNFIKAALEIQDMGHEIGLHNDLISLWVGTGISPKDQLEDILDNLRQNGIHVSGTASHGSSLCYKYHYVNNQIFEEARRAESVHDSQLDVNGKMLDLYSLRMNDFDLKYEAYFCKHDVCTSDSGNKPAIYYGGNKKDIARNSVDGEIFASCICEFTQPSIIQCIVHPDHWTIQLASGKSNIQRGLHEIAGDFLNAKKKTNLFIAKNHPGVIYANVQNIDSSYNLEYTKDVFHFHGQETWLNDILPSLDSRLADNKILNVLELGCGQGDFLALLMAIIQERNKAAVGVGVDAFFSGIASCAGKYPHLRWVVDNGENFLDKTLAGTPPSADMPGQFDLILDKTGLTAIPDFDSAYTVLKKISYSLSPGGSYIYMASAEFYARRYADKDCWPLSWIQAARKAFPHTRELSNGGRLIFEFGNKGVCWAP